jgi:hypothetical protein
MTNRAWLHKEARPTRTGLAVYYRIAEAVADRRRAVVEIAHHGQAHRE